MHQPKPLPSFGNKNTSFDFGLFPIGAEIRLIINCLISLVFVPQLHTAHIVGRISQTLKDEGLNGQNREGGGERGAGTNTICLPLWRNGHGNEADYEQVKTLSAPSPPEKLPITWFARGGYHIKCDIRPAFTKSSFANAWDKTCWTLNKCCWKLQNCIQ